MGRVSAVVAIALVMCVAGIQATSLLVPSFPEPSLGTALIGGKLIAKKIVIAKGAKLIKAKILAPVLAKKVVGAAAKTVPVKKLLPLVPLLKKPYVVAVPIYSKTVLNAEPKAEWHTAPWPSTAWPSAEAWPSNAWPSSYSAWASPSKTSSVWPSTGLGSGVYGGFAYGSPVVGQESTYSFTSLAPKVAAAPSFAYKSSAEAQPPTYSSLAPKVSAAPSFAYGSSDAVQAPAYSFASLASNVAAAPSFTYGSSDAVQAPAYSLASLPTKVAAAPSFAYGSFGAAQAPAAYVAGPAQTYSFATQPETPKAAEAPSAAPCPEGDPASYGEGFADSVKQTGAAAAAAAPAEPVSYASYTVTKPLPGTAYSSSHTTPVAAALPAPVAQVFSSTPKLAVVSGYAAFASGGHGGGVWAYPNAPTAEWPSAYYKTKQATLGQKVTL